MFNFRTLGDVIQSVMKKPGANPQETKQVEPQVAETKPAAKKKTTRKAK